MVREKLLRVLGYSTKCLWADLAVLCGLGGVAVGIGYGNMAVATGGVSVSVGAAWLSIRQNQQALVSQQPQRAIAPSDIQNPTLDYSQPESLRQTLDLCRSFYNLSSNFQRIDVKNALQNLLSGNFKEQDVQEVLESLLTAFFPSSTIKELVVERPYPSGSSKIDFFLEDQACGIEVKVTRPSENSGDSVRRIFKELAEDIEGYRPLMENKNMKYLIFFIYDHFNKLESPCSFEKRLRGDRGGFEVITIVVQNPCHFLSHLVNSSASVPSPAHDQSSDSDA